MVHMGNSSQQTIKVMHIVDEQEITRYNMWRQNKKGQLTNSKETIETLSSLNYPQNPGFLTNLVKHGCILKNGTGRNTQYCVPPKPVHKDSLQAAWESYLHPKKKPKKFELDVTALIQQHPEAVIAQLKNMGYKILRCEWKEC